MACDHAKKNGRERGPKPRLASKERTRTWGTGHRAVFPRQEPRSLALLGMTIYRGMTLRNERQRPSLRAALALGSELQCPDEPEQVIGMYAEESGSLGVVSVRLLNRLLDNF